MSVRNRITLLEGKMAALGVYPLCRGRGKRRSPSSGPRTVRSRPCLRPEGCPQCGNVDLTVFRVVWEDRPLGSAARNRRW